MQSMSETRRGFLATLGAALPAMAASKKRPVIVPPNIVLVLADELPAGMLGCYGNRDLKTPNINALARRGVRFQNAFASSGGGAVGRGVLLAGRTPMQQAAGPSEVLLTDLLAAKGYDVAFAGVWGMGNDKQPGHGIRWAYTLAGEQRFWNGESIQEQSPDKGDAPAILARRGVQFLEQQKPEGKPFILTIANPASAGVASLDNQVQLLVGKLRERNLEENTMVVFTAAGGSPDSLRVPLIYCWPGHAPVEATQPDLVGGYDLIYTLCAAVEANPPGTNLCGRSYLPLVQGRAFPKRAPWRAIVYGSFGDGPETVDTASDNRFRLAIRNDGKGPNQLFDLRGDPYRTGTNQFGNRAFVTTRDLLRRSLAQWKTQYTR